MKEVSRLTFNKIIGNSVLLKECKYCGVAMGEIIVKLPWYGRFGALVKCSNCGAETPIHGVTVCISSEKTLGTPTLYGSMLSGIKKAVTDWNNGLYGYRVEKSKILKDKSGKILYGKE